MKKTGKIPFMMMLLFIAGSLLSTSALAGDEKGSLLPPTPKKDVVSKD